MDVWRRVERAKSWTGVIIRESQRGAKPLSKILPLHAKNTSPSFFEGWRGGQRG